MSGHVVSQRVAQGTASDHVAAVLHTQSGEDLQLVKLGDNPFADKHASALVGHEVEVEGYRIGGQLRYLKATVL